MPSQPESIAVAKEPSKAASPRKSRSPKKSSMKSKSPKPAKKMRGKGEKKSAPKTHPPFLKMVTEALSKINDRKGSARVTILKYIMANYRIEEEETKIKTSLSKALKNGLKSEELKKASGLGLSGRFKLNIKPKKGAKKEAGQEKKKANKTAPKKPKAKVAGRSKQKQSEAAGGSGDMMKPAAPKGKKTTPAPKKVSPKKPKVAKKSAGKMSMGKSGKTAVSGRKAPAAKAKKGMTTPKAAKKAVSKKK